MEYNYWCSGSTPKQRQLTRTVSNDNHKEENSQDTKNSVNLSRQGKFTKGMQNILEKLFLTRNSFSGCERPKLKQTNSNSSITEEVRRYFANSAIKISIKHCSSTSLYGFELRNWANLAICLLYLSAPAGDDNDHVPGEDSEGDPETGGDGGRGEAPRPQQDQDQRDPQRREHQLWRVSR